MKGCSVLQQKGPVFEHRRGGGATNVNRKWFLQMGRATDHVHDPHPHVHVTVTFTFPDLYLDGSFSSKLVHDGIFVLFSGGRSRVLE